MSDRRQELYDRIRSGSKASVIHEEMVRLGFWPAAGQETGELGELLTRQRELEAQLAAMRTEQARLQDEGKVLEAVRKQRMAAARARRVEVRERRAAERVARAQVWRATKSRTIVFLGRGVSAGLADTRSNAEALTKNGLPDFADAGALAMAMEIPVGQLRFLAFARAASRTTHWRRFTVPKKVGGVRHISAPMPRLKAAQHWILANVLSRVPVHDAAHGFVPGRSIVSNARPHVGSAVVVNLDLKDFFPSVAYPRVWGLFRSLGYSPHIATVFALICTEPPLAEVELDGRTWYVARGQRVLPQGAPTSPAITNLLCRRLDRRLQGVAHTLGFRYTRYADDLSFSAPREPGVTSEAVGRLLRRARFVVRAEGFEVHPDKTRVHRRGGRQEVTGLTVNDGLGVERAALRKARAALHRAETRGLDAVAFGAPGVDVLESLRGWANFVCMVDPVKGAAFKARVDALAGRVRPAEPPVAAAAPGPAPVEGPVPTAPEVVPAAPEASPPAPPQDPPAEPSPESGETPWWKLW